MARQHLLARSESLVADAGQRLAGQVVAQVPQGLGVERDDDGQHQGQRAKREQPRLRQHRGQAGHLDDGDQDADHQHLRHAPFARRLHGAQHAVKAGHLDSAAQAQGHIQQGTELDGGKEDGKQEDHRRHDVHLLVPQHADGTEQGGAGRQAIDVEFDDGEKLGDQEDKGGAQGQRHYLGQFGRCAARVGAPVQHRAATDAARLFAGTQRTFAVQHAAVMTANQVVSVHSMKFAGARSATFPC
ncbi:hypothetical protein D3C72_1467600 [compost metagenome]